MICLLWCWQQKRSAHCLRDRKETENLTDFEITEENEAAELKLSKAIFPEDFATMVH